MKRLAPAFAPSLIAVFLAACAAEPTGQTNTESTTQAAPATAAATESASDMSCTREYPTGSSIPITKCRTREQVQAEKAVATENLRRNQTGGTNAKLGGNN